MLFIATQAEEVNYVLLDRARPLVVRSGPRPISFICGWKAEEAMLNPMTVFINLLALGLSL